MNCLKVDKFKIYKNKTKSVVFKYEWIFCEYQVGERYLKIMLSIQPIKAADKGFDEEGSPVMFPELEQVVLKLMAKYAGIPMEKGLSTIGFCFSEYDMLLEFINTVSATMRVNGIVASPSITRYLAFSSYSYANDMLQYIFQAPITLNDIERHMKCCAKLNIENYDESVLGTFALESEQTFDPNKELDFTFYDNLIKEMIDHNLDKLGKLGDTLKSRLKACNPHTIVEVQSPSEEVRKAQEFWY